MYSVSPNTTDSKFYNLTIEDKNGEADMFVTKYQPTANWLNDKDQVFEGNISTLRGAGVFTHILPDDAGGTNQNYDGLGNNYGSPQGSPYYPTNCDGEVIVTMETIIVRCTCENHLPNQCNQQNPCVNPGYYATIPYYYCNLDNGNWNSNNPNTTGGTNTGGSTSGDGNNNDPDDPRTSITIINGGGAPGNVFGEEDDDFISDCNLLENLSTSPDFINKMQELINNTSGNTEIGYFGSTDSNGDTTLPVRVESPENVRGFDTTIYSTEQVDVFMHNHFNNGQGSLYVFSGSDLYTLYQLYLNGNITDTNNFVMLVATPGGSGVNDEETLYAITIKNETSFVTFGANFLHDFFLIDNLYNNDTNLISPNISNDLNEERFAKLLKTFNSGLTVFKGDKDNLSSWSKLKVKNNNTLIEKNCN